MEGDSIPTDPTTFSEAVTTDDLIAALLAAASASADGSDADGMTTTELCLATGRSDKWVRKRLWDLRRAGRLNIAYGLRGNLSGSVTCVPVYSVAKESPAD